MVAASDLNVGSEVSVQSEVTTESEVTMGSEVNTESEVPAESEFDILAILAGGKIDESAESEDDSLRFDPYIQKTQYKS